MLEKIVNNDFLNSNILNQKIKKNIVNDIYIDKKMSLKNEEVKQFLKNYKEALSMTEEIDLGASNIFKLLGNIRSMLIENIPNLGNKINQKEVQSKIQGILSEIDSTSKIQFNEIKLFTGALNINFLIFNKNYNLNLNQDLSTKGLGLSDLKVEKESINKIDKALKRTQDLLDNSKNFEEKMVKEIKTKQEPLKNIEKLNSLLFKGYESSKGSFINLMI